MEGFEEFIRTYGYFAVFLGSLVEGESVILTASIMASWGYLSLTKTMVIAFTGTLIADQALYYVGRIWGDRIIERFPKLAKPPERAFKLLHEWDVWFILVCRFIYGIRVVSPIVIGASGVLPRKFIPLNIIAAVIWTVVSCVGGYMLGEIAEEIGLQVIKDYLFISILGLIVLLFLGIFLFRWRKKRRLAQESNQSEESEL